MLKLKKYGLEKIMHIKIERFFKAFKAKNFFMSAVFLWFIFMNVLSCMPVDISEPPFSEENFAPMILSATPDSFNGPYNYSELPSNKIIVKIIDLNTTDTLTLGWYVKDANNQLEVPYKTVTLRKATDDSTSNEAIFSFELKEEYLVCGLNRITLLVSDRGLKDGGLSEGNGKPYPSKFEILKDETNANKVKVNLRNWLIRKECTQ